MDTLTFYLVPLHSFVQFRKSVIGQHVNTLKSQSASNVKWGNIHRPKCLGAWCNKGYEETKACLQCIASNRSSYCEVQYIDSFHHVEGSKKTTNVLLLLLQPAKEKVKR